MSLLGKEQIVQANLEDEMRSSYLDYSMSVIVSRALPDVRDGLKPVHRRILFAMQELGLAPNRAYKKSARLVGEVLGKYHPHGDSSVYEAMVRLAQEWNMRYPLVDGQGNYGSVDGDPAAAMRYTETRLAHIATQTLKDLDKNTVDFQSNFDESLKEPKVLPTILPTLLVNGASGIAVGMATNIPPHNLREIVSGLLELIKNPEITDIELMQYVPAPDFPTGGLIYGYEGVKEAYLTGRGKIILRAKTGVEENKQKTKQSLIITELPYQVNKANLIEKIADLVRAKTLDGISGLNDESDREGMRIVIDLKRDAMPEIVLNNLYKHTQLQVTFGTIMLSLVNGRPRILTLKQMMEYFIKHRNEVVVRRTQFELDTAEKRAHILEGFIIALDNIDEVIKTIRESRDPASASTALQSKFALSEIQSKAILDMRLQRLTGLEREKIEKEYHELIQLIERLRSILASRDLQMQIIAEELTELSNKYGDARRTEIVKDASEITLEDMIANEDVIVTISHKGFIKRTPVSTYRRQNKGGRGLSGSSTYEDDYIEFIYQASTHHFFLFFTDSGKVYKIKVYDIPEGSRTAKGRSLANIINKEQSEKVTAVLPVKEFTDQEYILMCTRFGTIKKTELNAFANVRQNGIIAVNLHDDDKLVSVRITDGTNDVIIGTHNGLACRFRESEVRPMGRTAAGIRGISLADDDFVISMIVIKRADAQILVVSENGLGKRTRYEDFRLTKRGAKGVISMNVTDKTGKVVGILPAVDSDDLVVMTVNGILIRQSVSQIRTIGRNTQGVKLIRLDDGDSIADITCVARDDEEETNHDIEDNDENKDEQTTILD
ncbi:MAG TPA: DNA gyrase subunit A [Candidatus Kapabacteria bacterium]|nr:DNA gyrase subunit A [Candidatus Kapabacteria bacterium]